MTASKSIYEYLYCTQNGTFNFKKLGNMVLEINLINTFAASYLNTQGLNNSCLKSRQRRP